MGLARAFLEGGSGAVIATQWPKGATSADLMGGFYHELAAGAPPAGALRAAQLTLRPWDGHLPPEEAFMRQALSAVSVLAGALLLVGAPAPVHPQQFEGIVTIKSLRLSPELVTAQIGEDEPDEQKARDKVFALTIDRLVQLGARVEEQRMQLKGTRIRSVDVQMPGMGTGYVLTDAAAGIMRTVMSSQRGYYEISLRDLPTSDSEPAAEEPRVEPLGRTQMVSGLRCTGYRVTEGDKVSLVWTTGDAAYRELMQTWMRLMTIGGGKGEGRSRETALARSFLERYGYPVMRQKLAEDKTYTVEVWSVVRQALADSLFAVPAGFKKLHMPGMP